LGCFVCCKRRWHSMTRFQRYSRAYALQQVTAIEKSILIYLCHVADKALVCRVQQDKIAKALGLSRSAVMRNMKDLEDRGYVDRTSQKRVLTGHRDADIIKLRWLRSAFREPDYKKFTESKAKSNAAQSRIGQCSPEPQPISNTIRDGETASCPLKMIVGGKP